MKRGRRRLLALTALTCAAAPLAAQPSGDCEWVAPTGMMVGRTFGESLVTYVQTPGLSCPDGLFIRADSAAFFETSGLYQFIGNVLFDDAAQRLEADEAEYFRDADRIAARGSVVLVRKSDSTRVEGEDLDYLQANDTRSEDQLTVRGGRPRALLRPEVRSSSAPDTSAAGPEPTREERAPYEVVADRITIRGEQAFRADGDVEIERGELRAFAQEVDYNGAAGQLLLRREARMNGESYDLTGSLILIQLPDDDVREVLARVDAVLVGETLDLRAPLIRLFLTDGLLDRLVATTIDDDQARPDPPAQPPLSPVAPAATADSLAALHPARPEARAEGFWITADSLDVTAPLEVLEEVFATGSARAVSTARDSLNTEDTPEIARRDWIQGDVVVATFVPMDPDDRPVRSEGDSARAPYRLEQLLARGQAATLYRMAASDSTTAATGEAAPPAGEDTSEAAAEAAARAEPAAGPGREGPPTTRRPAVHYVTGDEITVTLDGGEVRSMIVEGQTRGVHLEPPAPTRAQAPDSTRGGAARGRSVASRTPPRSGGAS